MIEIDCLVVVTLDRLVILSAMLCTPGLRRLNLAEKNMRRKLNSIFSRSLCVILKVINVAGQYLHLQQHFGEY